MASTVFVLDSSFRRTQVKVTPGTPLRDVLEDACRSRKLSPEAYTLKTQNNKTVDLSQPFRLSGLTAGAKLQLTQASRSPGVVTIALQLPESEGGGRLSDKFASSTSLWMVLRKYEDGVAGPSNKLNLTQRGAPSASSGSGRLLYEQPCLNLMGRSLESFSDLQKTLAQLGLTAGSSLLRLSFKLTDKPLEEAMQEMSGYFDAADPNSTSDSTILKTESNQAVNTPEADQRDSDNAQASPAENKAPNDNHVYEQQLNTSTSTPFDTLPTDQRSDVANNIIHGIAVYRAPSSSTPAAALQPDDEAVFEPTVDHAKAHQAALQRASKNQRLLSDKELEEQERQRQQQLATVQSVAVRVRYPDQLMIETQVTATESASRLYTRIRQTLASSSELFELRFQGSKGQEIIPDSDKILLVQNLGFRGRVLVNFAWASTSSLAARQGPSLKEEYRAHATELRVELATQQATRDASDAAAAREKASAQAEKKPQGSKVDVEAKLKKFMGFGRK